MTRTRKWLVGIAASLLLLVTAVSLFDWNLARPYIARQVTSTTGRSFAINGDLDVHLSLWPRIVANDIVMGNAAWSNDPAMVKIKRADFRIDMLKLLGGHLAFPEISLSEIHLVLEVNKDGVANWVFDQKGKQREFPDIDKLAIDRGIVKFRDPVITTDLAHRAQYAARHQRQSGIHARSDWYRPVQRHENHAPRERRSVARAAQCRPAVSAQGDRDTGNDQGQHRRNADRSPALQ